MSTRQRQTTAVTKDHAKHSSSASASPPPAASAPAPPPAPDFDPEASTWVDVALTVFILILMLATVSYLTTHTWTFGLMGSLLSTSSLASAPTPAPTPNPTPVADSSSQPSLVELDTAAQTQQQQAQTQGPPELAGASANEAAPTTATDQATAGTATGADGKPRKRFRKKKPRGSRTFTLAELATFDGSDPDKPIYIAIKGHVYDVSGGKQYYGKGRGYNIFAGRDCSRAFLTGCFKERYPGHDLRGLTEDQMKEIDNWVKFYQDHETYFYVGELVLPEVTEHDPLPNEDCSVYDDLPMTPIPQDSTPTEAPTSAPTTAPTQDAPQPDPTPAPTEAPAAA